MSPVFEKKRKRFRPHNAKARSAMALLAVFVLFLVVAATIVLWAMVTLHEQQRETASSGSSSGETSQVPSFDDSDRRTLLWIMTDGGAVQGVVVLRFDPAANSMQALSVPNNTVVYAGTEEWRFDKLEAEQGVVQARDALSRQLGLPFDNYLAISYENLEKLISYGEGGLVFNLEEDLNYQDSTLNIHLDKGLRTLSASQVAALLRYPAWTEGDAAASKAQGRVVAAIFNQYMVASRSSMIGEDFGQLVNSATVTDLMRSHYNEAKEGLEHLMSLNDGKLCRVLTLPGEYQGSGDARRFYPDEAFSKEPQEFFDKTAEKDK